jgi:hypothetical protein
MGERSMPPHPLTRQGIGAARYLGCRADSVAACCVVAPVPSDSPIDAAAKLSKRCLPLSGFNGRFSLSQWGINSWTPGVWSRPLRLWQSDFRARTRAATGELARISSPCDIAESDRAHRLDLVRSPRSRRPLVGRGMCAASVAVSDVLGEDRLEMSATDRSSSAFAGGDRTGVLMTLMP